MLPSPEDEIEAVLPAELLASLDEPLEADDEEDEMVGPPARATQGPQLGRERTRDTGAPRTTGASTTGSGATPAAHRRVTPDHATSAPSAAPAHTHGGTHAGSTGGGSSTTGSERNERRPAAGSQGSFRPARPDLEAAPPARLPAPPPTGAPFPTAVAPGEAMLVVARAIASRTGGSLCFVEGAVERRIVLREGDIVTAASTRRRRVAPRVPRRPRRPAARDRAAARARSSRRSAATPAPRSSREGTCGRTRCGPTLRAHAEWVLARVLQTPSGRLVVEATAAGPAGGRAERLRRIDRRRGVRRARAPHRVAGGRRRAARRRRRAPRRRAAAPRCSRSARSAPDGARRACARSRGGRCATLLDGAPEGDLATVVFALAQLGVLEVLRRRSATRARGARRGLRGRRRARRRGDPRAGAGARCSSSTTATTSRCSASPATRRATRCAARSSSCGARSIRRAMLTPEVADLAPDVRKITVVLEEAYEILKDTARRDRYRRAIEAVPDV